jgi:hypothetical protein
MSNQVLPMSEEGSDRNPSRIIILLEEYKTVRAESLQSIQTRFQVVTFAFGALSVMIAGLFTSQALSELLLGSIACFLVPQIAKVALLMWLGEYHRSARAGQYLRFIEGKINELVRGDYVLSWETSLVHGRSTHMTYPYVATALVVLLVSYVSLAFGISQFAMLKMANPVLDFSHLGLGIRRVADLFTEGLTALAVWEIWFWCFFRLKWTQARKLTFEDFRPRGC